MAFPRIEIFPRAKEPLTGDEDLLVSQDGVTRKTSTQSIAAVAVAASTYDLTVELPGDLSPSTRVVNFKAVRPFTLMAEGHQGGCAEANPSGAAVSFFVKKNGSYSGVGGTITFNTDGSFASNIATTSFVAGDLLTVETPGVLNGMNTPFFTLAMKLV